MQSRNDLSPKIFIFITVALDALGFGIVIPVEPDLVMQIGHASQSAAAFWLGAILAVYSAMQFVASPVLGALSDRFGRRPILLLALSAAGLSALLTAFVPNLPCFFAIRMFAGATSGNTAAAAAYLADITPEEGRAKNFGVIGALYGLGFVLGPAIGGILGAAGVRVPFLASAALAACNVVYGTILLKESLPPEKRRPFELRRANPLSSFTEVFAEKSTRCLALAWCCIWFALGSQQSSFILANEMRFHWSTMQNGLILAFAGAASAFTQTVLVGRIAARFGPKRTAITGMLFLVAGYVAYGVAVRPTIMFSGALVLALGALATPSVQAMVSASAAADRQGQVQGALSSLQSLMAVIAPFAMGWLFKHSTQQGSAVHFPGAPFLLGAVACLGGAFALPWMGKATAEL